MAAFALDNSTAPRRAVYGPVGTLQRARLYAPGGATVADLPLAESPAGTYSGSVALTSPADSTSPYEYEVRQVSVQSSGGFTASTTVTVSRGTYAYLSGGVWYALAPSAPTNNHRYSLAGLVDAARHALGGSPPASLDLADVVNDALAWLCDYHPWLWLRRPLSLAFVADQAFVALPADFKQLHNLALASSSWLPVQAVTIEDVQRMRANTVGVLPAGVYYAVGFAPQATLAGEPTYRLELWPTPSADAADALTGTYLRQVPALAADASLPDIPAPWHPALKAAVRAQAKAQQYDETSDDWQLAAAQLDKLVMLDGAAQPSLGPMRGAVSRMRGGCDTNYLRGTIVPPT